jgi:hypothetical protein
VTVLVLASFNTLTMLIYNASLYVLK